MKIKLIIAFVSILIIAFTASTSLAKRCVPKPVQSIIKDGIEYAAPLDHDQIGYVTATWLKTKRVIWSRQIYTIKYEYKHRLEQDVQNCFITKLALIDNIVITNEFSYKYELDLNSLKVSRFNK